MSIKLPEKVWIESFFNDLFLLMSVSVRCTAILHVPVRSKMSCVAGHMEAELAHREPPQHKGHINIPSSDSEVEIVGVQENTR